MECEQEKKSLVQKITGVPDSIIELADLVEGSVLEDTVPHNEMTAQFQASVENAGIGLWLSSILEEVDNIVSLNDDGDRDNIMFNKEFSKYFVDLCKLFPLWGSICCQFFPGSKPTATTASVESHMKVLKQSMQDVIPCSVDKFVQENMDMNQGLIIESSQDYIKFITDDGQMQFEVPENRSDKEMDTGDDLNADETQTEQMEANTEVYGSHLLTCPACKDGNFPSNAHKCVVCGRSVHIFPECSDSIGDSEGYGERRMCKICKHRQIQQQNSLITGMGHKEQWNRKSKRETKKSKYLAPAPNWNLNHHFDKNVKLGFLQNGNMSSRVYIINKEFVGLRNTSTFDALAQVE